MKNPLKEIEDYFIQRRMQKAVNKKFKELPIRPHYAPNNLYTRKGKKYSSTVRMTLLAGSDTNLFFPVAISKLKPEIKEFRKQGKNYYFDVSIIGRKCEVKKTKHFCGEIYTWSEIQDKENQEGYLNIGYTKNPEVLEELEEFDKEVLSLEKQGKIIPRQLKELVRSQEAVEWKRRKEIGERNAKERWGKNKSCPQCLGEGEEPAGGYNNFKKCGGCGGTGKIETFEGMRRFFVPSVKDLESITETNWFKYKQKRMEQMQGLGLRQPSYRAGIYVKVIERKN